MRFLYAVLCLLLVAWAAFAAPPAQHPRKVPQAPGRDPVASGSVSCMCEGTGRACLCGSQGWKCVDDRCPSSEKAAKSGVVTYEEVDHPDTLGRPAKWLKPSDPKLPWIFKGYLTNRSRPLTIGYQSEYTSPFSIQCSGPA